jgi:hypothetical protein
MLAPDRGRSTGPEWGWDVRASAPQRNANLHLRCAAAEFPDRRGSQSGRVSNGNADNNDVRYVCAGSVRACMPA